VKPGSTSGTSENGGVRTSKRQAYQRFRVKIRSRPARPAAGRPNVLCNPLKSLTFARPARPAPKGGTEPTGRAPTGAPASVVKNKKLAATVSRLPAVAAGEYRCSRGQPSAAAPPTVKPGPLTQDRRALQAAAAAQSTCPSFSQSALPHPHPL
jgi:hypothetical protein